MAGTKSFLAQELSKFYEAAWLELPAVAGETLLGASDEEKLRQAGWKTYDAWISLTNEFTNQLYSNRMVGEITGRTMESLLRWRQIGGALTSAFFGNLWPAVELPTRGELSALRDELIELREALTAYLIAVPAALQDGTNQIPEDKLRLIWKAAGNGRAPGFISNPDGHRPTKEGKRSAAA